MTTKKRGSARKPARGSNKPVVRDTERTKASPSAKTAAKPAAKRAEKSPLRGEAYAIVGIAAAIVIFISLISGVDTGFFGVIINGFLKGCFGFGAVLVPLFILLLSLNAFRTARLPAKSGLALIVCVIAAFHLFGSRYPALTNDTAITAGEYIKTRYTGGAFTNGGLMGALLGDGLRALIGLIGARILTIAIATALAVVVTNRSLAGLLRRGARRVRGGFIFEDYEDYAEEEEEMPQKAPQNSKRVRPKEPVPRIIPSLRVLGGGEEDERITIIGRSGAPTARDKKERSGRRDPVPFGDCFYEKAVEEEEDVLTSADGETTRYGAIKSAFKRVIESKEETDIPPWEEAPDGISITGTGVEGFHAAVVDADGEIVEATVGKPPVRLEHREYVYPPVELLKENPYVPSTASRAEIIENSRKLEETLKSFGVEARVVEVCKGPTVTRYEMAPGVGVKVSKISSLSDDLALNLAAETIRIEAPVPGKSVVGIEIPNKEAQSVYLRDVVDDEAFWAYPSKLSFAIGKDIAGNTVIADVAKMPHLLIAGATGAGKSVCINTLIASIVYKAAPDEVKLLMIDPKVVELSVYNPIPHLLIPVVTDPKKASGALSWAVREMELRYNMFAEAFVRDLRGFNAARAEIGEAPIPQIVIIIDELADLMMTCGKEVEESICRLAQKARAAGLHLIIATQRPSVDVITGLIKANIPSRLAFAVTSGTDSRTILDMVGAEKLLGKGDMLFSPVGLSKPQRIQGSFISDKEVENLVNFIRRDDAYEVDEEMVARITTREDADDYLPEGGDNVVEDAIAFVVSREKASVSMLQRKFRIGYNRAANVMEELEERGIVGPEDGSRPRKVLMTQYQFQEYKERRDRIEY